MRDPIRFMERICALRSRGVSPEVREAIAQAGDESLLAQVETATAADIEALNRVVSGKEKP